MPSKGIVAIVTWKKGRRWASSCSSSFSSSSPLANLSRIKCALLASSKGYWKKNERAKTEKYAMRSYTFFPVGALPIRYTQCGSPLYYAPLLSMANGKTLYILFLMIIFFPLRFLSHTNSHSSPSIPPLTWLSRRNYNQRLICRWLIGSSTHTHAVIHVTLCDIEKKTLDSWIHYRFASPACTLWKHLDSISGVLRQLNM